MRKTGSADKSPHVGRDYLRPDEANALIDAAGKLGRQRLRNVSTTMIQPGSKFKLGSSTLVDDLDEFRHSARRVLLAELETHQIQATH
jgi:hypothetical protein